MAGFLAPLARFFDLTTPYGAPTAAGPHAGEPHNALDFGAPWGEPVFSMSDGIVLQPNGNPEGVTGGTTITIDYGLDDQGRRIIATFAHLSESIVRPGDRVKRGQHIGNVGNTGITTGGTPTASNPHPGSHLHLDTWADGVKINPLDLFDWTGAESVTPEAYGGEWSIANILAELTESTKEDIGNRTWGQYANEINTDFGILGGFSFQREHIQQAVAKLGWADKTIEVGDIPRIAAEIVDLGDDTDPLQAVGNIARTAADFVATVLNPQTWARVAAMILGVAMAAFGAYMIWSATA